MVLKSKGKFILFEGITSSGKTTQVKLLFDYLKNKGVKVLLNKEPTGMRFGVLIRSLIERREPNLSDFPDFFKSEVRGKFDMEIKNILQKLEVQKELQELERQLLFVADRRDDLEKIINPNLENGFSIIQDRYDLSTFAHGMSKNCQFEELLNWQTGGLKNYRAPDLTIFIRVSPETAYKRLTKSKKTKDIYDEISLIKKISQFYELSVEKFKKIYPRIEIISGEGSIKEVHEEIVKKINSLIK